jgi:hypothetical protein
MKTKDNHSKLDLILSTSSSNRPSWWNDIPAEFRDKCRYINAANWTLSAECKNLINIYKENFDAEIVHKRIPRNNWIRADICYQMMPSDTAILDIGSGLGEFVNLCSLNFKSTITSVDIKDYNLWFKASKNIKRVNKSVLELNSKSKTSVATCFEVIEHFPQSLLLKVIEKLRYLAKDKLYISVPFMEPLPLYRAHHTRFDSQLLNILFPDALFTVIDKNSKNKPLSWVMIEIDCR